MAGCPEIEGVSIQTTTNTAYEVMKQQRQGEMLKDDPPGGPPMIEGVFIPTTSNTAYEAMKQPGQGGNLGDSDIIVRPPGGPPPIVDEIYYKPSSPIYNYVPGDPPSPTIRHGPAHLT